VNDTLMESDAVEPIGRAEGDTSPGRTRKKPKDLSVSESEECVCVGSLGVDILL
jgi:hypothetical protein